MKSTIGIRLDWFIQTIGISTAVVLASVGRITAAWTTAAVLLLWQFGSAIISVVLTKGRDSSRALFLLLVFFFFSTFFFHKILAAAGPAVLMIHYWILTTKSVRRYRHHTGKFLRHISF